MSPLLNVMSAHRGMDVATTASVLLRTTMCSSLVIATCYFVGALVVSRSVHSELVLASKGRHKAWTYRYLQRDVRRQQVVAPGHGVKHAKLVVSLAAVYQVSQTPRLYAGMIYEIQKDPNDRGSRKHTVARQYWPPRRHVGCCGLGLGHEQGVYELRQCKRSCPG